MTTDPDKSICPNCMAVGDKIKLNGLVNPLPFGWAHAVVTTNLGKVIDGVVCTDCVYAIKAALAIRRDRVHRDTTLSNE